MFLITRPSEEADPPRTSVSTPAPGGFRAGFGAAVIAFTNNNCFSDFGISIAAQSMNTAPINMDKPVYVSTRSKQGSGKASSDSSSGSGNAMVG